MTCYEYVPRLSFSRRFVLWILAIGVTGNVAGRFGRQGAADDEEARRIGPHVAAGINCRYKPHRGLASAGDAPRISPALRRR